jgi:hypothetical protein
VRPGGHTVPQLPQLLESAWRLAQIAPASELQDTVGARQGPPSAPWPSPHWYGTPAPPQLSGAVQEPQLTMCPQPSLMGPQLAFSAVQLFGLQLLVESVPVEPSLPKWGVVESSDASGPVTSVPESVSPPPKSEPGLAVPHAAMVRANEAEPKPRAIGRRCKDHLTV